MKQTDYFSYVNITWIKMLSSNWVLVGKKFRAGRIKELRPVLVSDISDFAVWREELGSSGRI